MSDIGFIYLIRNLIDGRGYVGQTTTSIRQRWLEHLALARKGGGSMPICRAIAKYGAGNFSIQQIASAKKILLNDLEAHYIKFFGTYAPTGHGYNLTEGGQQVHASLKGVKQKPETIEKRRQILKGRKRPPRSPEWSAKIRAAKLGKKRGPMSEAQKIKIGAASKRMWAKRKAASQ